MAVALALGIKTQSTNRRRICDAQLPGSGWYHKVPYNARALRIFECHTCASMTPFSPRPRANIARALKAEQIAFPVLRVHTGLHNSQRLVRIHHVSLLS